MDGFSRILLEEYEDKIDGAGRDYLLRVRNASQRMDRLIDDILILSHVSRKDLSKERIDLSMIAQDVLSDIRKVNESRQVEVFVQPDLFAQGDLSLIRVVISNLFDNAWKFTSKTKNAKIEFGKMAEDKENIFFIKDNGVGFDMRYSDKLFVAFQRLHSEKDFPGTGIGLVSVKRIITRHKGRSWCHSEEGKGATFYFTLP
jgi:light-regulated signal transduction histidine kinase (bacteriophytochrome)